MGKHTGAPKSHNCESRLQCACSTTRAIAYIATSEGFACLSQSTPTLVHRASTGARPKPSEASSSARSGVASTTAGEALALRLHIDSQEDPVRDSERGSQGSIDRGVEGTLEAHCEASLSTRPRLRLTLSSTSRRTPAGQLARRLTRLLARHPGARSASHQATARGE